MTYFIISFTPSYNWCFLITIHLVNTLFTIIIYLIIYIGGARGIMVIIAVQILDKTDCISHSTNTLGKGMNPIILPPAMGK